MLYSRNTFKAMAIILMVIDHLALFFLNNNILLRTIGRLSFPMFVYLLLDGYRRTRNVEKYGLRLILLWAISIIPYSMAFYGVPFGPMQNIFAALALYLGVFCLLDKEYVPIWVKTIMVVLIAMLANNLDIEYSWYGVAVAVAMYYWDGKLQIDLFIPLFFLSIVYGQMLGAPHQAFASLVVFLLPLFGTFQESKRPNGSLSAMSYLFYPVHLGFIALLRL